MPSNTLTIDPDQRAALHRQVIQHLSGISDVYVAYAQGEFAQMLDDLSWAPVDLRDSFELRMPAEELTQTLARLRSEVEGARSARRASRQDGGRGDRRSLPAHEEGLRRTTRRP